MHKFMRTLRAIDRALVHVGPAYLAFIAFWVLLAILGYQADGQEYHWILFWIGVPVFLFGAWVEGIDHYLKEKEKAQAAKDAAEKPRH